MEINLSDPNFNMSPTSYNINCKALHVPLTRLEASNLHYKAVNVGFFPKNLPLFTALIHFCRMINKVCP